MTGLLLLHLVLGVSLVLAGPRAARAAVAVAAVAPVATLVWLWTRLGGVVDGDAVTERSSWVPSLGLDVDLRLDGFGALMVALISGIGILVVGYAARYFDDRGARTVRLLGVTTLFAGSMLGVVVADNLILLYACWELTSITSFFLIGSRHEDPAARAAAMHALVVTGLGALAMLGGFVVLGEAAGTYRLSAILADPPTGGAVPVALVLVLMGALTKSAQLPFHSWLPAAMTAPTPVSAYLHSATMVKAGVYLVARLAPAFATVTPWRWVTVGVGALTMVVAGAQALRQTDLKLLLAFGTVSQLGFMIAVFGWGSPGAVEAGAVMVLAHGAFKAAAFMVVGVVDRTSGTRDVHQLPRLPPGPVLAVAMIAAASMAGVPLVFGFVAKDGAFAALDGADASGATAALVAVVVGTVLTVAYSIRFVLGLTGRLAANGASATSTPPRMSFVAPAALLAAITVLLGLWPGALDDLVGAAAASLAPNAHATHLRLWHGTTLALGVSLLALAGGVALAVVTRGREVSPGAPAGTAFEAGLLATDRVSALVTTVTQPGALPTYLGAILATAAAVPLALLFTGGWWPGWPDGVETRSHLVVAAALLGFAVAAAAVRRRFSAALFLGMTGYAMAGLFVVQGAPDLALTQVAIETLTTVLFVLVLRRLPDRFELAATEARRRRSSLATLRQSLRVLVALGVAAFVFAMTLAVGAQDPPTTASDTMITDAYDEADGRNVVNVILVDFRGFDTLGEITVLTVGAIGTVALARAGRRPEPDTGRPGATSAPPSVPLARLITIDVSVRIVFAAVMVGSLWLLFAGHNQPGGGFVGGIVAGAAVALRYAAGGIAEVRRLSRGQPWMVLGTGVLLAVVTALVPLAFGQTVLESGSWTVDAPLLGVIKLTSALAFDIGVYVAVIGLALMVFESFGDDPWEGA